MQHELACCGPPWFDCASAPSNLPWAQKHSTRTSWLCSNWASLLLFAGPQYQSIQGLLGEFSAYAARVPNKHLRPASRPRNAKACKQWWHYAATVILQRSQRNQVHWKQLSVVSLLRVLSAFCKQNYSIVLCQLMSQVHIHIVTKCNAVIFVCNHLFCKEVPAIWDHSSYQH